jgi:hypothetical protein
MTQNASRRGAIIGAGTSLLAAAAGSVPSAEAEQKIAMPNAGGQMPPPMATNFAQVTKPASGVLMPEGYARALAQFAYLWGWPLVNQANRRAGVVGAPTPGLLGGIVPIAPRGRIAMLVDYIDPGEAFVTCPNQDVVYGNGYFSLDVEPAVIQVPDFGDRFWVYAFYDARSDQFGRIGKPYNTRPGFYLFAGPNWRGAVPAGIAEVVRSPTELANAIPRIFLNDTAEDRAALRPLVRRLSARRIRRANEDRRLRQLAAFPGSTFAAWRRREEMGCPRSFFRGASGRA